MTYTFTVGALSSTELCEEGRYIPITWTVTDLEVTKLAVQKISQSIYLHWMM